ncbi:hypothetical protein C7N43_20250 [Sphingobacteriales bacterium UPWRP_1]|nr:hypothetical protein BVG80_02215 [Sphingobacteriales bacterium TSM_CSM]PSJ75158.1 hypothetical protein C7N43_20250 [Sphingobacteriales bacterium UPWRP_1]
MKFNATFSFFLAMLLAANSISAQPYQIGTKATSFFDAARNRNIGAQIRYPANSAGADVPVASGQFPVIVFGHGFQITYDSYSQMWETLVPQGYIMVFPTTEGSLSPNHGNFGGDISYLVNAMQVENANAGSIFFNKVAPKSAIMGHSMGGGAAHLAASSGNSNITTLISLAAAETDPSAIGASASIGIPSLVIAATEDCVTPVGDNQLPMYQNITSNCKAYYEITGGAHCQFTNGNATLCYLAEGLTCLFGWGPFVSLSVQHQKMFDALLPWLDTYLKDNCTAWTAFQNLLASGAGFTYQVPATSCSAATPVANAGPDQTVCAGTTVTLSAAPTGTTYAWNSGQSGQTIQVTPLQTTNYKVTVSNAYGCTASDAVLVTVNPAPAANAGPDQIICNGQTANLTASGGNIYNWSNGLAGAAISVTPAATATYTVTVTNANGCTASDAATVTVNPCGGLQVAVLLMLQGAYNPATGQMNTNLLASGALPIQQPYQTAPWFYNGTETVGAAQNFPPNTVDWVLLEARNPATGAIVERRAGLLLSNGLVVDADGNTPDGVKFFSLTNNSAYYIVVRHRNHLAIMSRQPEVIPNNANPLNFTNSGAEFGTNQTVALGNNIFGLFAGDLNADGIINHSDFNQYFTDYLLNTNYLPGDCNLNAITDLNDYNQYRPNAGVIGINEIRL